MPRDSEHDRDGASGSGRPPADLTGRFVGRYRVEERIGAGGMGQVYRARDTALGRDVALKRLHPGSVGSDENRRRILREARAASTLENPSIVAIHDVLESDGETFIVQEFVSGRPLSDRIGSPLDIPAFLTFLESCASALAAAEAKGIVHCDLKPGNIVLDEDGRPRILDFGIARRTLTDAQSTTVTSEDGIAGTPEYMAPEIIEGAPPTPASDIFSLGVICFELLTGLHPFRRPTTAATMASLLHDRPPAPASRNPAVPAALDALVLRMLARDPVERPPARDLVEALRGFRHGSLRLPAPSRRISPRTALLVALAATVALVAVMRMVQRAPTHVPRARHLLVHPFEGPEDDAALDAFATGLTEAVQIRIASLSGIHVIDASSGVGAPLALEGSVQESEGTLRIRYRLLDREKSVVVGGDVVEGRTDDLFALEDRVADGVARTLARAFGIGALAPAERPTQDVTAYGLYLKARGLLRGYQDERNVEAAVDLFRQALDLDPRFALALAGLGEAYWKRYESAHDPRWAREAELVSLRAVETDPDQAEAHVTLGTVYVGTGRAGDAAREFRRALDLDPRSDAAYRGVAKSEEARGNVAAAEEAYLRAIRERPDYWAGHNDLGVFYFRHGRYEDALGAFRRVVALTPDNARGFSNLGAIYQSLGRNDEAIDAYRKSLAIRPNHRAHSNLATLLRSGRRFAEAAAEYEKALALEPNDYRIWGSLAGTLRFLSGRDAGADSALRRAASLAEEQLEVNPDDALLEALLAQYRADLGEQGEALRHADRALSLAPEQAEVLAHAAAAFELLGMRDRALEIIREAILAGYPPDELRDDPALEGLVSDPKFDTIASEAPAVSR